MPVLTCVLVLAHASTDKAKEYGILHTANQQMEMRLIESCSKLTRCQPLGDVTRKQHTDERVVLLNHVQNRPACVWSIAQYLRQRLRDQSLSYTN